MDYVFPLIGIAFCALTLLQFALWSTGSIQRLAHDRADFKKRMGLLRQRFESHYEKSNKPDRGWNGYRKFRVDRIERESETTKSVYLKPEDGAALPSFLPGQHLTFQFEIPGRAKPVVRCYSLSDRPDPAHYRITVKRALSSEPDAPPGVVSSYIHQQLSEGSILDVKAPGGSFWIDLNDARPCVLLAAGIGVTPMISMAKTINDHMPGRQLLMLYGITSSSDHAFQKELSLLQGSNKNLNILNCYSAPLGSDQLGSNFQIEGRITIELIRKIVPTPELPFYLCGPPGFMESMFAGLKQWGVADSNIHFEAFGPATIKKKSKPVAKTTSLDKPLKIEMPRSGVTLDWTGQCDSILEAAEENDIQLESGCRAGSCGTCAVKLLSGAVEYPADIQVNCEEGKVLACIARPQQDIVIEP